MRKIFLFIAFISMYFLGQAQYAPTSSKTRFVNGIGLSTKDTASLSNAGDTLAMIVGKDSLVYFKYKGYWKPIAYNSSLNSYVKYTDTSSMLSPYQRAYNAMKYTDTATMLSSYYNKTATNSLLNTKLNTSDTATMLSGYKTYYPRNAISGGTGISYNPSTGVITNTSSGTVTSVATNNGSGITGGTITTSGTIAADTSVLATRLRVQKGIDSLGAAKISGSGSGNYVAKFTGVGVTIGNSTMQDDGSKVSMSGQLEVGGYVKAGTSIQSEAYQNLTGYTGLSLSSGVGVPRVLIGIPTDDNTNKLQVQGGTRITGQLTLGSTITNGTYTYTLPSATGTIALVGGSGVGTVTSVATDATMTGGTITTTGTLKVDTTVMATRLRVQKGIDSVQSNVSLKLNISDTATMLSPYQRTSNAITSVGLSMPVAFTVSNTPLTSNGTIAVTGAGTASQYIRGDGQLATYSSGGGGGSSVNYYLNGGTAASVATYYQMSNTAVIGATANFSTGTTGLISQFLTDAGNPNTLTIPAGAWNFQLYFNASSTGGTPTYYVELYKYSVGGTFTLIASNSSSPDGITSGTSIELYVSNLSVPATTLLTTDRLAVRVYVSTSGRTITLYTQNSHLCKITTTFSSGISALNGLTANTQYFATGTSGTDFAVSSLTDTHTFNLPTASASNRGALSSADWTTFNSKGSGSVTSVATNTGSGITGGTITTSGTIAADTSVLSTKANVTASLLSKVSSVSGTSPIASSGGLTPTISISQSSGSTNGYLSSTDWTTFNNKGSGSVTSVATDVTMTGGTITTSGTLKVDTSVMATRLRVQKGIDSLGAAKQNAGTYVTSVTGTSPIVSSGGTTPAISIPMATTSVNGYLSSTDWTTFNNKQSALTNPVTGTGTTNYLPKFTGTSTIGNSAITDVSGIIKIGTTASTTYGTLTIVQQSVAAPSFVRGIQLVHPNGTGVTGGYLGISVSGQKQGQIQVGDDSNVGDLIINPAGGNLGLGVTPSAWNLYKAIQVQGASIANFDISDNSIVGSNVFYGGSSNDFRYISTGTSTMYRLNGGAHSWYNAISGSANAAITFTQAMTLTASGRLLINKTNEETYQLDVNGTGRTIGTGSNTILGGTGLRVSSSNTGLYLNFSPSFTGGVEGEIASSENGLRIVAAGSGQNTMRFLTSNASGVSTLALSINGTQAATFSSSVTANGGFISIQGAQQNSLWLNQNAGGTSTGYLVGRSYGSTDTQDFFIYDVASATRVLAIASTGAATFSSTGSFGNATLNGAYLVVKGANGVPASSGTTTTAVFRVSSGTGLYNVLDFGTNEASDYSWIQSTRANSLGTYDYLAIQPNGGNLLVGTLTNAGYKLDVNGTGRFSGILTINSGASATSTNIYNNGDFISNWIGNSTVQLFSIRNNSTAGVYLNTQNSSPLILGVSTGTTGGTVVNHLSIASTGAATFSSTIKTGTLAGGYSAGAWKFGTKFTTTTTHDATGYITVDIDGTTYYLALATPL